MTGIDEPVIGTNWYKATNQKKEVKEVEKGPTRSELFYGKNEPC